VQSQSWAEPLQS